MDPEQLEHHKDNSIDQFDIEVIEMEDEDVSNNKSESIESQEEEVGEKEEVEEDQGSNWMWIYIHFINAKYMVITTVAKRTSATKRRISLFLLFRLVMVLIS